MLNSLNEWGKLKEVIVGNPYHTPFPKTTDNVDISFRLFYHDNLYINNSKIETKKNISPVDICFMDKKIEEERIQDVELFVSTLEKEGIKVYRPEKFNLKIISSNNWSSVNSPAGTVRDQVIIYGNNIIETAPQVRCRFNENELLYDIFYEKFNGGCNWYQMPKSRMRDEHFDTSYITKCFESKVNNLYEIMFDGAQCLRFNDRLLINTSTKNHSLGVEWLKRILPNTCIDEVHFVDSHLDGTFMPIDEGLMLIGPKFMANHKLDELPKWLQYWDFIVLDDYDKSDADKMCLASETIFINCLSLGDKTIVLNELAINLRKKLESKGYNVIPLPMRHDRLYGGSFHCITLDLVRE